MNTQRLVGAVSVSISILFLGTSVNTFASQAEPTQTPSALTVSIDNFAGSDVDSTKAKQAAALMQTVLNSEQFHQAILNFKNGDGQNQFVDNYITLVDKTVVPDVTNQQVYETIMAGAEQITGTQASADHVANLNLNIYSPPFFKKWGTKGYGYAGQPEIFLNWNWFNRFTVAELAGNVTHEWCHKLGFEHAFKPDPTRPYSVPYAVGDIMAELAANLLE